MNDGVACMNHTDLTFTFLPQVTSRFTTGHLLTMLASYLSIQSVQRQVAVMSRELHLTYSESHSSCHPVALQFFLHQVEGLGRTWTAYRDSLLSTLHTFSLMDRDSFEPGSVAYQDLLLLIEETRIYTLQAHQVIVWLLSLRDQLISLSHK